jgi:hypothetical protein
VHATNDLVNGPRAFAHVRRGNKASNNTVKAAAALPLCSPRCAASVPRAQSPSGLPALSNYSPSVCLTVCPPSPLPLSHARVDERITATAGKEKKKEPHRHGGTKPQDTQVSSHVLRVLHCGLYFTQPLGRAAPRGAGRIITMQVPRRWWWPCSKMPKPTYLMPIICRSS